MTNQRINTFAAAIAFPAVIALGITGCSSSTGGEPVADGTSAAAAPASSSTAKAGDCAAVSGRVLTLPAKAAGEPTVGLPQPDGWERTTMLDSELIRATIANKKLAAGGVAATAVVTVEKVSGANAQQALDAQLNSLRTALKTEDIAVQPGTLCGFPTSTMTYTPPAGGDDQKATALAVSVPDGANTWSITVTVQSKMPDDPTYRRDSQAILTGLQIQAR